MKMLDLSFLTLALDGIEHISAGPRQIGPGKRSVLTLHRKIAADETRKTPGAERMRAVIARRKANWE